MAARPPEKTTAAALLRLYFARTGLPVFLVLLVGGVGSVWAGLQAYDLEHSRREQRFNAEAIEVRTAVEERIKLYDQVLEAAQSFAGLQEHLTRAEWEAYADRLRLDNDLPGIVGLVVTGRVARSDVNGFVRVLQEEDEPDYAIWPKSNREEILPVIRVAPRDTNGAAMGFDITSNPIAVPAQIRARDTGEPSITAPLRLVQRREKVGGVIYLPLYRRGMPTDTLAQRRAAFIGLTGAPLDFADLFNGVAGQRTHLLTLTVTDPRGSDDLKTLYTEGAERSGGDSMPLFERVDTISKGGATWRLRFRSVPQLEAGLLAPGLLAGGVTWIITMLLAVAVHSQTRARRRAVALAQRMTGRLKVSEQQFRRAFNASALGMAKLGIDGQVIAANPALANLLRRGLHEILSIHWTSVVRSEDQFAVLRRTRRMLRDERVSHVKLEVRLTSEQGRQTHVVLTLAAVRDSDGSPVSLVCELQDITDRKRMEERFRYHATHDPLTDLPTRSLLLDRIAREFATARRHPSYLFAVLYIDLDAFKPINDQHGHAAGDAVLVEIAGRLRESLRDTDSLASRLGGDEFVVLLRDLDSPDAVKRIAARLADRISQPYRVEGATVRCGASVGAALSSDGYATPDAMLQAADARMYEVKAGRNPIAAAA